MKLFNTPNSGFELLTMIFLIVPLLTFYEGLQEWLVIRITSMTNYTTASVLGACDETHENTADANGELRRKNREKTRMAVDPSGNHVGEIQVQVPVRAKMSIAGIQFYIFHAICQTFFPWYIFTIIASKTILGLIIIPYVREKWDWLTFKIQYYKSANFIIDQLNKLPLATPIKKTYSSLTTYPMFLIGPLVVVIFWAFKKVYLGKTINRNVPHGPKDSRGQAALNLGLMVLAFIGYSDFGMWKKFQDWIRFSEYATKAFGDAAADTTCENYQPGKFNLRCTGTAKGPNPCIVCAADKMTKEPRLQAAITRKFDQRSIMDDPAPYFYELVYHLFINDKEIPDWYLRLRPDLQAQIFKSHYRAVWEKVRKAVHLKDQITHEKLINGDYSFHRDERIQKWVIIATRDISDSESDYSESESEPFETIQAQYSIPDMYARQQEKEYQETQYKQNLRKRMNEDEKADQAFHTSVAAGNDLDEAQRTWLRSKGYVEDQDASFSKNVHTEHDEKRLATNKPHSGDADEHESALPMFNTPGIIVTAECLLCKAKVSYPVDGEAYCANCGQLNPPKTKPKIPRYHAEAFEFAEKENTFDLYEYFPFFKIFPRNTFKPLIFLTAMCLVLYGSYYYYRKRSKDQINTQLQNEIVKQTAEKIIEEENKFKEIPKILENIEIPDSNIPEGKKGGVSRHQPGRQKHKERYEKPTHRQIKTEDTSDVVIKNKTKFQQLKKQKQKNYIVYDIDKLDLVLQQQGVLFYDENSEQHLAKTMEEFRLYIQKGMQFEPNRAFEGGILDVENMNDEHPETERMQAFSNIASHKPISPVEYRFVKELIDNRAVVPDKHFERHMFDKNGHSLYRYDPKSGMYLWAPIPFQYQPGVPESQVTILKKNKIDEEIEEQPLQGLTPLSVREEDYERHKKLIQDLDFVQANDILQTKRKEQLDSLVISRPESNISTVASNVCPYGAACTTSGCVRIHPGKNVPEAMCGHLNITHYPEELRTDFAYPIFRKGSLRKEGTCYLTPLGFVSLKHVPKDRPLEEFYILIAGVQHELQSVEKFPEQHGYDKRVLPFDFQDNIVIKIKDHFKITKDLSSARTSLPRDNLDVMVVTAASNANIRTEVSILKQDPDTGMYLIKTHNDHGDSGSPVVDILKKTVIGTYWGAKMDGTTVIGNYVLPMELNFVAAINGNQKFQLSKNIRPSL